MWGSIKLSLSVALVAAASPAFAHCKDARKTCEFGAYCIYSQTNWDLMKTAVDTGVGQAVWGQLEACSKRGVTHPKTGRSFKDIAKACTDGEYMSIGSAALLKARGNEGACNALPP